ncbi:uncharacterized protein PV09_09416 [Verruconis gallopava]|uniref:Zn(2)-C6 fungal-type domain-containing protein n=1 Tax=Verruconis gallopava TaxID=253628 RepID=A0A0D1X9J2_9PEZI|nr:uncharacterized protein PV09_09416 [Verruconis gallopava]KIV98845.1 hypothetical protein PV09_09416 [Verruconis gallopava]
MPDPDNATGPVKRQRVLACQRCRRRKQKCTDSRPCENCVQSGSECVPFESSITAATGNEYVQRLEERVAQLEAQIPREGLDHLQLERLRSRESVSHLMTRNEGQNSPSSSHEFPDLTHSPVGFHVSAHTPMVTDMAPPRSAASNRSSGAPLGGGHQFEVTELGVEQERALLETYFRMAHAQYPFLLRHEVYQWIDAWWAQRGNPSEELKWQAFFVHMIYAIGLVMTKSRLDGPTLAQKLHATATTMYLPHLKSLSNPLRRAQGLLLLTVYCLHMPSQENIISLSSMTIRFCIMSQFHLLETEPKVLSRDEIIEIQVRRRVFWCAYAIDRAVCSTFDFPCSIPDDNITVPLFDDVDDDQLLTSWDPSAAISPAVATMMTPALHVIKSRQIESEMQEMMLRKSFSPESSQAFHWRSMMLVKLQEWNSISRSSPEPFQKGYVSLRWLEMIYYYHIISLFRPTKALASGIAGDWSVHSCCKALTLFRRFQMAREIAKPWLGLLTQFQIGVTLLYCFFATPPSQWKDSYRSPDVLDAIRACSTTLAILADRWTEAECTRDVFEVLAREVPVAENWRRPTRMSERGRKDIEQNWPLLQSTVIHRPTLRMIHEMAAEDFAQDDDLDVDVASGVNPEARSEMPSTGEFDLQWIDPSHGPLGDMATHFNRSGATGLYTANFDLDYG